MDPPRKPLHTSKSFTRLDTVPTQHPLSRSRASTLQGPPVPPVPEILYPKNVSLSPEETAVPPAGDIFASQEDEEEQDNIRELAVPDSFEDLPIEIRSLTERYGLVRRMCSSFSCI